MDERTAKIGKPAFSCPHCRAFTQQAWFNLFADGEKSEYVYAYDWERLSAHIEELEKKAATLYGNEATEIVRAIKNFRKLRDLVGSGDPGFIEGWDYKSVGLISNAHLSQCFVCNRVALWVGDRIIFPARSADVDEPNQDIPADIRRDYEEAAEVLPVSPRSSAALLRLAIQKLCSSIVGRDGDINEMIGELVGQGLSPKVQMALDVVRVVGNEAVHPGTLDLRDDPSTAHRLFALVNLIADAMISQPKHVEELYANLPPTKLAGIAQRNVKALVKPKPA